MCLCNLVLFSVHLPRFSLAFGFPRNFPDFSLWVSVFFLSALCSFRPGDHDQGRVVAKSANFHNSNAKPNWTTCSARTVFAPVCELKAILFATYGPGTGIPVVGIRTRTISKKARTSIRPRVIRVLGETAVVLRRQDRGSPHKS